MTDIDHMITTRSPTREREFIECLVIPFHNRYSPHPSTAQWASYCHRCSCTIARADRIYLLFPLHHNPGRHTTDLYTIDRGLDEPAEENPVYFYENAVCGYVYGGGYVSEVISISFSNVTVTSSASWNLTECFHSWTVTGTATPNESGNGNGNESASSNESVIPYVSALDVYGSFVFLEAVPLGWPPPAVHAASFCGQYHRDGHRVILGDRPPHSFCGQHRDDRYQRHRFPLR